MTASNYYLSPHACSPNAKSPMIFGAATRENGYTSFYRMPMYVFPELRGPARQGDKRFEKAGLA